MQCEAGLFIEGEAHGHCYDYVQGMGRSGPRFFREGQHLDASNGRRTGTAAVFRNTNALNAWISRPTANVS